MRNAIIAGVASGTLLLASVTAAAAWDDRSPGYYRDGYYRDGQVLGLMGDAVRGVLRIATAPLALLAEAGRDGRPHYLEEDGAYPVSPEMARDYYGAGAVYYGPPPRTWGLDGR